MSCPNYKIIFNDETKYVVQDITEEPVVRVIPAKGEPGPQGPQGEQGEQGPQGKQGPQGEDGKNFEPTIVSELPETGEENKLYLTPKNYTRSSATGNPITATVTEEAGKIESFQLDGDTFQQTYTGKNLLNYNTISTTSLNGVSCSLGNDGTITLNGSCTTDNTRFSFSGLSILLDGSYTLSFELVDGSINNATSDTAIRMFKTGYTGPIVVGLGNTSSSATASVSGEYSINDIRIDAGVVLNNYQIKVQLEKSATATSYEPYVGGQPSPSPEYPQPIQTVTGLQTVKVTGKNLFNLNGDQQPNTRCTGTINGQSITITSTVNSTGFYSIVIPNSSELLGKTATLSVGDIVASSDVETTGRVLIYQAVSTQPRDVGNNLGAVDIRSAGSTTFTFPSSFQRGKDCFAVVLYATARGIDTVVGEYSTYTNIQLELGSPATDYEPYSSNDYEINLGKNLYQSIAVTTPNYGMTSEVLPDGRVRIHGKATSNSSNFLGNMATNLPAGTYTFSITGELPFRLLLRSDDSQNHWVLNAGQTKVTQTISNTLNTIWVWGYQLVSGTDYDITIGIQLEKGSTATPFAPYKTPIELCKIGDYHDYIYKDGEDWKIHKATGKVALSSITWEAYAGTLKRSGTNPIANMVYVADNQQVGFGLTEGFQIRKGSGLSAESLLGYFAIDTNRIAFNVGSGGSDPAGNLYYALATPTNTIITDQTLIAQLEAIRTASLQNGANTITNTATGSNLAGDMEIGYYGYNPRNRYDKWLWLDINNEYEQLNNPDTATTTAAVATAETTNLSSERNLSLTNIQSNSNEIKNDEEQEDVTFNDVEDL